MPKVSDEHLRARRQEILDASARCFARTGFQRTTIQDISAESGLSAGLIYRYFTDKDGIITAIAEQWHDHRRTQLEPDLVAGYLGLLRTLAEPAEQERVRLGVEIWAEALRSPQVLAEARRGVDDPRAAVATLTDDDGLARVFIAIYQGLALQTAWDPDLDNAAFVRAVQALLDGVNPGSRARGR